MARKRKNAGHEEHTDETWLIPYSDILTLLLALFIVLFASSQIDQEKFKAIESAFKQVFGGSTGIMDAGPSPVPGQAPENASPASAENVKKENSQLTSVQDNINKFIAENHLTGKIDTILTDEGLVLEIRNETLFRPGSASLSLESQPLISKIADILGTLTESIVISGHTDDTPINTPRYPSNWDLSSARAINVMKDILNLNKELHPQRFSAIGYGEYRPIVPNITEANRAKNRRVEILIVRTYPIIKN